MNQSRRFLLLGLSGAAATTAIGAIQPSKSAAQSGQSRLAKKIIAAFDQLPGQKSLKLLAPEAGGQSQWSVTSNPDTVLVCASAFKVFVLATVLRQLEASLTGGQKSLSDQLGEKLDQELVLNQSVYSTGAGVFNPPDLSGKVLLKTVLQAMMLSSDNTATDMALKFAKPDRVRQFLKQIGLKNTRIPNSTRQFAAYVFGYPKWQTITYAQLIELLQNDPHPHRPILNDVSTFASTASDFVSFYARALQGEFFKYPETFDRFKAYLSISDSFPLRDAWRSRPLGMNVFMKQGWSQGILCRAGGVWFPTSKRWMYFSITVNWDSPEPIDEVEPQFLNTANQVLVWVKDAFGN